MKPDASVDLALADEVARFYADPLGFVMFAYPWTELGMLRDYCGPDQWQRQFLVDLGQMVTDRAFDGLTAVDPVRMAASSGHGIGKGVLAAWLTNWILSTRPHSQGTVTANTAPQLETKTWATIQKWTRLCITAHWFEIGATRIKARTAPESWFVSAQTCREENTESFAGQHAATSTSYFIFDEASAIPDAIWTVAEGGLTDGEPMMFVFGNPTRNSGKFHRICFGADRARWNQRVIDSRQCRFPNKELVAQWVADYGEDSDFVRVRVRGLAPRASDSQFIDSDRVYEAQRRQVTVLRDEPLIAGLDVARGGSDNCVLRFRCGPDAASHPPIVIPGEQARDSMRLVSVAADVLRRDFNGQRVALLCVDETGLGGPIVDRLVQLGHHNVIGVQFGALSPDPQQANQRSYMWSRMRDWLARGRIDRDPQLEADLLAPGFSHNSRDKLLLESKESLKKRGLASPDHGDALALTFAAADYVAGLVTGSGGVGKVEHEFDPFL